MDVVEVPIKSMEAAEASQQFDEVLKEVSRTEARVILKKDGVPIAGIVSAADMETLRRSDERRRQAIEALHEVREAFKDVPEEELERQVALALAEVRAEMREERRKQQEA